MENTNNLKLIGNLSVNTHRQVSVIKADNCLSSMETTMKFILRVFNSVEDIERKKHIEYINNEEYKTEESV